MIDPLYISSLITEDPDLNGTYAEPEVRSVHGGLQTDLGPGDDLLGPTELGTGHTGAGGIEQKLNELYSTNLPEPKEPIGTKPAAAQPRDTMDIVNTVDERKDPTITSKKQLKFFQLAAAGKLSKDYPGHPKGVPIPGKAAAKRVLAKHASSGTKLDREYSGSRFARYKNRRRKLKGRPGVEESAIPEYTPVSEEFLTKLDEALK